GCANIRPGLGLGWSYTYKRIAPDTYKVHVSESRFASTGEAEELFKEASEKVVEVNHCGGYRIISYSTYLKSAFPMASIPEIEGKIICLHGSS
ncbi:MAG TPA: hypothetical protein PLK99_10785, partial [Burkholderiales bacterium]|nr:hypothetical protein [Burkholderiales bacterium]